MKSTNYIYKKVDKELSSVVSLNMYQTWIGKQILPPRGLHAKGRTCAQHRGRGQKAAEEMDQRLKR